MKMKLPFFFMSFLLLCSSVIAQVSGVRGKISSVSGCSDKVMVWLSLDKEDYKERLLLMHTEVPVGGTFQFNLKKGSYQLRASDEKGCDFLQRITVNTSVIDVPVKMVKK